MNARWASAVLSAALSVVPLDAGTPNAAARAAFDRGLHLYYAYNPDAAFRAFRSAASADRHYAMAWWGLAMAKAGNLNVSTEPRRLALARTAIRKAREVSGFATPLQRRLIDAASARFAPAGAENLEAYVRAMRAAYETVPKNVDAATLYGEALLESANGLGSARSSLTRAQQNARIKRATAVLRAAFDAAPSAGPAHFLIHAAELSGDVRAALPAAKWLDRATLDDESSHLAHMSAHVYLRAGSFARAASASARAVRLEDRYRARHRMAPYDSAAFYRRHDLDFALFSLLAQHDAESASRWARREGDADTATEVALYRQRWAAVLQDRRTDSLAATFARGIALAHFGDAHGAARTIAQLAAYLPPGANGAEIAAFAEACVNAELRAAQRRYRDALDALVAAKRIQSSMHSGDLPLFFFYPLESRLAQLRLMSRSLTAALPDFML